MIRSSSSVLRAGIGPDGSPGCSPPGEPAGTRQTKRTRAQIPPEAGQRPKRSLKSRQSLAHGGNDASNLAGTRQMDETKSSGPTGKGRTGRLPPSGRLGRERTIRWRRSGRPRRLRRDHLQRSGRPGRVRTGRLQRLGRLGRGRMTRLRRPGRPGRSRTTRSSLPVLVLGPRFVRRPPDSARKFSGAGPRRIRLALGGVSGVSLHRSTGANVRSRRKTRAPRECIRRGRDGCSRTPLCRCEPRQETGIISSFQRSSAPRR